MTQAIPSGFDFEKERYIPGLFDSVDLVLAGAPSILNAQVAPDISNRRARVRMWLKCENKGGVILEIREAKSGKIAGRKLIANYGGKSGDGRHITDFRLPFVVAGDPFLYKLIARTSGDEFATRFGMREFKFDPTTGRAMLNGKPYFMRGSNITLYRFFEDGDCGDLPLERKMGAPASSASQRHALELPALLHRPCARNVVPHRGRGGHSHPGRISRSGSVAPVGANGRVN